MSFRFRRAFLQVAVVDLTFRRGRRGEERGFSRGMFVGLLFRCKRFPQLAFFVLIAGGDVIIPGIFASRQLPLNRLEHVPENVFLNLTNLEDL